MLCARGFLIFLTFLTLADILRGQCIDYSLFGSQTTWPTGVRVVRGLKTQHGAANGWWHRRGHGLGNKVTWPLTRSRTAKVKASWPRDILTAAVERTNRNDDLEGAIMEFFSPASAHDAGKRWKCQTSPIRLKKMRAKYQTRRQQAPWRVI